MKYDPVNQTDPLSRTVVHLTMFFNDVTLATGTGVLAKLPFSNSGEISKFNGMLFLITALHNVSGREPNGKAKGSTGGFPNAVLCEGFNFKERFSLYQGENDPSRDTPFFWVHPGGPAIDVTVLPLEHIRHYRGTLDQSFLDPHSNEVAMRIFVSQTCHIIGFPEGLVDRSHQNLILPIWKTGHIATEPAIPFCGEPVTLIDATTRPGMSGAPVIVKKDDTYNVGRRLVGIYTGRTSNSSDIGRVFWPRVIEQIFRNGPCHNHPF